MLPPPGTEARERKFCGQWLRLVDGEKVDLIVDAELREAAASTVDPVCRTGLRGAVRHKLDSECRNWKQLMSFEVRAIVDGVLKQCESKQS